jgi:restriction endonuclease S subunit
MTTVTANPRAFVVWFKDLDRWDVAYFRRIQWTWPAAVLRPLGEALVRKTREVDTKSDKVVVPIIEKISFGGDVSLTDPENRAKYKGRLYWAEAGELVYSKIRVKQGSLAIVPPAMSRLAVSAEYPIYAIKPSVADGEYLVLVLKSRAFQSFLEGLSHGGSTKTRLHPTEFERLTVPLPPLAAQRAIVRRWQEAQDEIAKSNDAIRKRQDDLEATLLRKIGIRLLPPTPRTGALGFYWKDIERWDTFFYRPDFVDLEKQLTAQKARPLGELAHFVSRPWSKADFPDGVFRYVEISCVSREKGIADARPVDVQKAPSRATTLIKTGDILLSTTRPYLGAFTIVPTDYDNCVCTSGFAVADAVDEMRVDKRFLLHFLKGPAGLRQMERRMTGGLYPAIVQSELEKVRLPLPPLKVQQNFVTEAEKVQEQIKKDRQAAAKLSAEVAQEVEEMILGTRPVR